MLAALSLLALRIAGLGALCWLPLRREGAPGIGVAAALVLGLLADLLLVVTLGSLAWAARVGWILAALGLGLGGLRLWRARPHLLRPGARGVALALLLLCVGLLATRSLEFPLVQWDARSIWFFHARIIHHEGALAAASGWSAPELAFSHPDYPKLLPVLGAQAARALGHWNEYLPKVALVGLALPAALAGLALCRAPLAGFLWLALLFGRPHALLWNGQADGYLAIYAGLGAVGLARGLAERRPAELGLGLACAGVACNLKNEGALLLLCLLAAAPWVAGLRRPAGGWGRAAAALGCGLLPLLLWRAKAALWGLRSDLEISLATLDRAALRAFDGSLGEVAGALLVGQGFVPLLGVGVAAALACRALHVPLPRAALLPLVAAVLYLGALALVYLGTPHELAWHLGTSAHRTPLPALLLVAAAAFVLLDALERGPAPQPRDGPERRRTATAPA